MRAWNFKKLSGRGRGNRNHDGKFYAKQLKKDQMGIVRNCIP
jgi:hypothetical protein